MNYPNSMHGMDNMEYRQFLQHEGFAQGCPMNSGLAAIILSMLLKNINDELQDLHNFNTSTPTPHTSSFIHDTNLFIPVDDVEWFIAQFEELRRPLGIKLNKQKTKVLIGPDTHLNNKHKQIIQKLSKTLKPTNILHNGCILLGQAIGTHSYIEN
jgi:hypothetical protein